MANRYAIVENGLVTNVVVAEAYIAHNNGWIDCPVAGPGWTYADGVFTEPPEPAPITVTAPTKEELLAELQALTAKINALG